MPDINRANKKQSPKKDVQEETSLDAALKADEKKLNSKDNFLSKIEGKYIAYAVGGFVFLLLILMMYSCQPAKGSMAYGVCSVFLEQNTTYPHSINHIGVEGSRTAVRIYFTTTDAFGEYKQEMLECTFGPDEAMGMRVTQIARNRKPVDGALVQEFNKSLPAIIASDPYRAMPPNWKNPLLN